MIDTHSGCLQLLSGNNGGVLMSATTRNVIAMASLLFMGGSLALMAQPPRPKTAVVVDFTPVRGVTESGRTGVQLEIQMSNGRTFHSPDVFFKERGEAGEAALSLSRYFARILGKKRPDDPIDPLDDPPLGLETQDLGGRLLVTGYQDDKGAFHDVRRIRLASGGFPAQYLPTVTATEGIKIQRHSVFRTQGQQKPTDGPKWAVIVDASPLAGVTGAGRVSLYLEFEMSNGSVFRPSVSFEPRAADRNVPSVCRVLDGAFGDKHRLDNPFLEPGLEIENLGTRLVVTGYRDVKGVPQYVRKVRVTTGGTFPNEHLPTIVATDGIELQRGTDKEGAK